MIPARFLLLPAFLTATAAVALEPDFPGTLEVRADMSPADSVRLPDAPWAADRVPREIAGAVRRRAFRVPGSALTTLQLLSPLEEALSAAGYDTVFACADAACGGFDFRFQLDLLGEPEMHVDIGDFRYLLVQRPDAPDGTPHTVSVVTSRSLEDGFIHLTEVFSAAPPPEMTTTEAAPDDSEDPEAGAPGGGTLIDRLLADGHVVLEDLEFASGAAELGTGPYSSLERLGRWLGANPGARIALVGHSDSVGSLEANTALSRRRARAVVDRLVGVYGVAPQQLSGEGAGYLAPRASNLTPEGRALNRRVEVVLLELEN